MNPYMCPLSRAVMRDPVILLNNGESYEREFLMRRLEADPAFGGEFNPPFWPNANLRSLIERLQQHDPLGLLTADMPPFGPIN